MAKDNAKVTRAGRGGNVNRWDKDKVKLSVVLHQFFEEEGEVLKYLANLPKELVPSFLKTMLLLGFHQNKESFVSDNGYLVPNPVLLFASKKQDFSKDKGSKGGQVEVFEEQNQHALYEAQHASLGNELGKPVEQTSNAPSPQAVTPVQPPEPPPSPSKTQPSFSFLTREVEQSTADKVLKY